MASSTTPSRPASSSRSGIAKAMPACRILSLARTSRLAMAAGEVRKADAMVSAFRPSTTCRISGARMPVSIAGCAQANISARRRSGISVVRRGVEPVAEDLQLGGRNLAAAALARGIDDLAARRR